MELKNLPKLAYDLYRLSWISEHIGMQKLMEEVKTYYDGLIDSPEEYSFENYLEEFGFSPGSTLYACYDEFINNELQNKDYIKKLLGDKFYPVYLDYLDECKFPYYLDMLQDAFAKEHICLELYEKGCSYQEDDEYEEHFIEDEFAWVIDPDDASAVPDLKNEKCWNRDLQSFLSFCDDALMYPENTSQEEWQFINKRFIQNFNCHYFEKFIQN